MTAADELKRIGAAFHRQAGEYDRHASLQRRVVARLERLVAANRRQAPAVALDIGCGTGAMLAALAGLYPHARLCGLDLAFNMARNSARRLGGDALIVNGDAGRLPFGDGTFDLVVSASTFQWVERLDRCFEECRRVLGRGGLLCVAFFGGRTLWELQESYREAVALRFGANDARRERMQRFREVAEVRSLVSGVGFDRAVIAVETEMEYHPEVGDLLRSIKGIGAATAARSDVGGGLGWRGLLTDMAAIYRARFMEGGVIPATYEVIYVVAVKES